MKKFKSDREACLAEPKLGSRVKQEIKLVE